MKQMLKEQKGQAGVTGLFLNLTIWAALTIAWVNISAELLTNIVAPLLNLQDFGGAGVSIMLLAANLLWYVIPILIIANAFSGRQNQL